MGIHLRSMVYSMYTMYTAPLSTIVVCIYRKVHCINSVYQFLNIYTYMYVYSIIIIIDQLISGTEMPFST